MLMLSSLNAGAVHNGTYLKNRGQGTSFYRSFWSVKIDIDRWPMVVVCVSARVR